ncbi:hypothetical protein ZIOFF_035469 [Zingiber officinale]|uniref:40S ribosomal protein S7 n=1 Tax=Zingiber officinale TaxID=94328 RepID=A0A8J5GKH7_ZINOF|nr:hypothetical protein ZIOFF_035469 [Zingiber officinale]
MCFALHLIIYCILCDRLSNKEPKCFLQKEKGLEPTEFEDTVAQAFFDLENGNQELKSDLKDIYINSAV